jgi:hypothetical protein
MGPPKSLGYRLRPLRGRRNFTTQTSIAVRSVIGGLYVHGVITELTIREMKVHRVKNSRNRVNCRLHQCLIEVCRRVVRRIIQSYEFAQLQAKDPATYDKQLREGKYGRLYAAIEDND